MSKLKHMSISELNRELNDELIRQQQLAKKADKLKKRIQPVVDEIEKCYTIINGSYSKVKWFRHYIQERKDSDKLSIF